jgi:hypothetical protein
LRRQSHTSDADDEAAVSLGIPVSVSGRGAPPVIKESQSPIRARRTEHVASISTRALHHRAWGATPTTDRRGSPRHREPPHEGRVS